MERILLNNEITRFRNEDQYLPRSKFGRLEGGVTEKEGMIKKKEIKFNTKQGNNTKKTPCAMKCNCEK